MLSSEDRAANVFSGFMFRERKTRMLSTSVVSAHRIKIAHSFKKERKEKYLWSENEKSGQLGMARCVKPRESGSPQRVKYSFGNERVWFGCQGFGVVVGGEREKDQVK